MTFTHDYLSEKIDPRTQKRRVMFRYVVDGPDAALDAYSAIQGPHLRTDADTGKLLYFSFSYVGDRATLLVNSDTGKAFPDVSELRKLASLADQFGPAVAASQTALGKLFSGKAEAPAAPKQA